MIGRRKKVEPVQRTPHVMRQQQSTFHYSSNRSQADHLQRKVVEDTDSNLKRFKAPSFQWPMRYNFGIAVFTLIAIYVSLLSAAPRVVIADGQQPLRSSDAYNNSVADYIGSGLLSHSKLTINRQKIANDIQLQFPELSDIHISTPLFSRSVHISAASTQPAILLATNDTSYIIDTRGVALFDIKRSKPAININKLLLVNDQSAIPIQIGKPAMSSVQVQFAQEIKRQSEAKQIPVETMLLSAGGGELDVKHTGMSYFVKYNLYEDARKSFGTFISTKEYIDNTKVVPAEYIDVRVAERAYIK